MALLTTFDVHSRGGTSSLVVSLRTREENLHLLIARSIDEKAAITLLLKSSQDEVDIRVLLPHLELTLAAHATDAVPQGTGNAAYASGKHDLTSKTVPATELVKLAVASDHTYVIWTILLDLPRPRARLQRPAVYFTALLTVSADMLNEARGSGKDYLNSLEPLSANVLEPLQFDPTLSNLDIYLSETRITKVAPATDRAREDIKPIRGASKRAVPIIPALFTRIKYSTLPDAVVASVHLETSRAISGKVLINSVNFGVANAHVQHLNATDWPLTTSTGDEMVLLYKLTQRIENTGACSYTVSARVAAEVRLDDGLQVELNLYWQGQVDLSQPPAKPTYKWSRPLSGSNIRPQARPSIPGGTRPTSLDAAYVSTADESGVTFNFWVTSTIPLKKDFKLNVQCINQSNRSRRFAIVVVQPKKKAATADEAKEVEGESLLASILNSPPQQFQSPPDVLDLNPDVRIGPLPPGACYETELKFWAPGTGVLSLGFIRIVDLDTRQTVDVKELPDIVMLELKDV